MANITFTEGSGLQNSIFGKSQEPIKLFIEKKAEAFEQQSMLPELFAMDTSTHFGEKITGMTAMDGFQPVGENGNYPTDGMQEGYSKFLEHMTWKDSFSISREIIEDGKLMDLRRQPAGFVTGYHRTREKFGAALLGNALQKKTTMSFGGVGFDCTAADGKPLFDKAHPSKLGKKAQTNCFADAFSADALAAMEAKMQDFRGDNEEVLDVTPSTILMPTTSPPVPVRNASALTDFLPTTAWRWICKRYPMNSMRTREMYGRQSSHCAVRTPSDSALITAADGGICSGRKRRHCRKI